MTNYAEQRREQYEHDVRIANDAYRNSGDLALFQKLDKIARDTWHNDIRAHYNNDAVNAELRDALAQGGRVYATLNTGETVRLHNVGNLYDVSDITGAPAEPLITRIVGGFTVKYTTVADLITRA